MEAASSERNTSDTAPHDPVERSREGTATVGVPAWAVSLVVHVAVLLTLASLVLDPPGGNLARIVVIDPRPDEEEEPYTPPAEVVVSDEPLPEAGAASEAGEGVAQAVAATFSAIPNVPVEPLPDLTDSVALKPLEVLPAATELDMSIVVPGQVGVGVTGAAGAVDRLTAEIRSKLDQRPTVVCWLFDQSLSLEAQRREIADRLQTVFEELGATRQSVRKPALTSMVIGFGERVNLFTQAPTGQAEDVVEAIRSIPIDESGAELTFTAVIEAAQQCRVFRTARPQKNVMMIVFTDEVGSGLMRPCISVAVLVFRCMSWVCPHHSACGKSASSLSILIRHFFRSLNGRRLSRGRKASIPRWSTFALDAMRMRRWILDLAPMRFHDSAAKQAASTSVCMPIVKAEAGFRIGKRPQCRRIFGISLMQR